MRSLNNIHKCFVCLTISALGLLSMTEVSKASSRQFSLVFANGMRNTVQGAEVSLQALRKNIILDLTYQSSRRRQSLNLPWKDKDSFVAYNFKDELLQELREVYRQKQTEKARQFWKWYYNEPQSSEEFKQLVMEEMIRCELGNRIGETLFEQSELLNDRLKDGHDLLIVAHSQGNLFSNSYYESKFLDGYLKRPVHLIAVATPASYVAGEGPYVTLTSDGVINDLLPFLVGEDLMKALPPNTTNKKPEPGSFDHGFVEHYLGGDVAGRKILNHIYEEFFEL